MKKILLITLLLFQLSIYAQENSKWNLGIEYSIDNLSIENGQYNDYLVKSEARMAVLLGGRKIEDVLGT